MVDFNRSISQSPLQQLQQRQETIFERLASGRRINGAADGAAAQQIIDRLTSQVEGNRQAITNAFDGISLTQVAEGGLSGVTDSVQRIRELSVQAGNGLLSDGDRNAIQAEISQLQEGISQTIENTNFGGQQLLTEDSSLSFLVGANGGQNIDVATTDIASGLNDILNVDVSTAAGAQNALEVADAAQDFIGSTRSDLGATANRFESAARNLAVADENVAAARSRIQDLDFAQGVSESVAVGVQSQASIAVQAQANQQRSAVLSLLG